MEVGVIVLLDALGVKNAYQRETTEVLQRRWNLVDRKLVLLMSLLKRELKKKSYNYSIRIQQPYDNVQIFLPFDTPIHGYKDTSTRTPKWYSVHHIGEVLIPFFRYALCHKIYFRGCISTGSLWFENWYLDMQKKMKEDSILQFFNSLRVCSVHIRSIKINRHISIHIRESPIQVLESVGVKVIRDGRVIQESSSPLTISSLSRDLPSYDSSREVKMHFTEKPDEDGYKLCREYLKRIENIVEECFRVAESDMK